MALASAIADISDTVWISMIAAASGIVGPIALGVMGYIFARSQKREDYARQDAVAAQAAVAARLLAESQARIATKTGEVATLLASTGATTNQRLDVIHTLVNSSYTEVLQTLLDALQAQRALLRNNPSAAGHEEIATLEKRIDELHTGLAERRKAAEDAAKKPAPAPIPGAPVGSKSAILSALADERTATATERVAEATERVAVATEQKP